MEILIVEDESLAAQKLCNLLKQVDHDFKIIDILETVEESINWFNNNTHPDLIFMDIQLNDGVCFEIFESVNISKPIIFTTAYDEYAINAFKVNRVDYLLKPIKFEDLKRAISKFNSIYNQTNYDIELRDIIKQFKKNYKERFFVKVGNHFKSILCTEIFGFYILEKSTFIFTSEGRSLSIDFSLEQLEKLIDPNLFYRISRSFIVNINAIKDIISYSTSRLELKVKNWDENLNIVVSRDRVAKFKKWIDR